MIRAFGRFIFLDVEHLNNVLAIRPNRSIIIDEKREGKPTKPERESP